MGHRQTNKALATVAGGTDKQTLHGLIHGQVKPDTKIFTDDHRAYEGLLNRQSVKHLVSEYVKGQAHTNGSLYSPKYYYPSGFFPAAKISFLEVWMLDDRQGRAQKERRSHL